MVSRGAIAVAIVILLLVAYLLWLVSLLFRLPCCRFPPVAGVPIIIAEVHAADCVTVVAVAVPTLCCVTVVAKTIVSKHYPKKRRKNLPHMFKKDNYLAAKEAWKCE